jgi:methionyl aminopeptidase
MAIILKSKPELQLMRKTGRLAQRLLRTLGEATHAEVTPKELDTIARKFLQQAGAKSPFLGHHGFPATITVSVNEVVVHAIPTSVPFREGDIVSIDVGTILNGFIGDNAWTFPVGEISDAAKRLLRVSEEALFLGIKAAKPGNRVGDIGWAIQEHCESHGYTLVKQLCGHGVGRSMWEDPQVPNYGRPGTGPLLKPGMTIAIEPMVNEGVEHIRHLPDKWTVVTADGKLSAHFEHCVAITSDGPEILTTID